MNKKATFGAGCFWGVEVNFRNLEGVLDAEVGYAGGHSDKVTYEEVCRGDTGHAEVVQVTYDPEVISFAKLVRAFVKLHDPTQKNRQGPDIGSQYRSVIFYQNEDEKSVARNIIEELDNAGQYHRPIETTLEPYTTYCSAEDYHQQYLAKRGKFRCG